jgi:TolB protein
MKIITILLTMGLLMSPKSSIGIFEKSSDVGNCKKSGSAAYDSKNKTYTLTGAGLNIWGKTDEFHFAWKKVTGDFTLSARTAFEGAGVVAHRKMGIMIRETLDGDSPYADAVVHGDGLTSLQYRLSKGDVTKEIKAEIKGADHLVLTRQGNKIIIKTGVGEYPSGNTAETEMTLPETCYVGLFICSHDADIIEKGYFNDVKLKKK